ncbi:tRNA (adenosine(37)-N6)-dimethylallyltransferase MiaA [Ruegeria pomeroyi]|uniref:tRNA dimethylallyltransferase n=1 Tax=Ruegeria alba TaxID=2916756 RepID=A0ABS9NRE4_9RHOB|nr:tRNA (adenosine(37)-N6)-dimethylallyltransferase MiaA [Ruegeria alba]MCE8524186.1 tRNA (adenosine(37)-N6)-dimethylallyltransferase MiaA [Ruegeria pomeroyi]MCG6556729.1 tRNA (adenosine(37)-N6)-dimethylallyltransferase MiaA [Ruegeria alba]
MAVGPALPPIPEGVPVLIAGPTASGKSALALEIAERFGGVIVNADASQVYNCWRAISARPSPEEEARAPHRLYGHLPYDAPYSAGHWLREVTPLLDGPDRPIIVGGTGLYFTALTEGMAEIPATPPDIRAEADALPLDTLLAGIDPATAAGLDRMNRARVQRAWEVERATGRALHLWQADTPPPPLPLARTVPLVLEVDKLWLWDRIARRFDQMLDEGALAEVAAMADRYDPALPAFKAIGVPELMAHLRGEITLDAARERASIATRQYAKRQRSWFRARMGNWHRLPVNG